MSNVTDRGVIDTFIKNKETGDVVLSIIDHLPWNCSIRVDHAKMLTDKINDYIDAIQGSWGQENCPGAKITIKVIAKESFSQYALDYFERMKEFLNSNNICDFKWGHLPPQEGEPEEVFHDGFSDDYVFDLNQIYPRIKKNHAKKPNKEIVIATIMSDGRSIDMPISRIYDSFVVFLVQDIGDSYKFILNADIPSDVSMEQINQKAFENLSSVKFECHSTKDEPGINMLTCGGNFEAESLLLPALWQHLADQVGDDLIIAVPTKDLVFFVPAKEKKLIKKMLDMSKRAILYSWANGTFQQDFFATDVFLYERAKNAISISKKWLINAAM